MASVEMSWGSLINGINRVGRDLPHIFFASCPESDDQLCMLVDDDEFDLDDDIPAVALSRGFVQGLLVDELQQVMENLRQQNPAAGRDTLFRAIAYYFDRDAFIDLSS